MKIRRHPSSHRKQSECERKGPIFLHLQVEVNRTQAFGRAGSFGGKTDLKVNRRNKIGLIVRPFAAGNRSEDHAAPT